MLGASSYAVPIALLLRRTTPRRASPGCHRAATRSSPTRARCSAGRRGPRTDPRSTATSVSRPQRALDARGTGEASPHAAEGGPWEHDTESVQHIPVFHPLLPFNFSAFPKICDFPQNRIFLTTVLYLNLYEISNKYSLRNPFCGA